MLVLELTQILVQNCKSGLTLAVLRQCLSFLPDYKFQVFDAHLVLRLKIEICSVKEFKMTWKLRKKPIGIKRIPRVPRIPKVRPIKPVQPVRPVKPVAPVGYEYYWKADK